jgi:chemotaxis protein MotB
MKAGEKQQIVVKRVIKKAPVSRHASSAWKIAYADFVTAMMAFFLLMWLLGSTTKGDLQGIAEYFKTPLRVALSGGEGSGDSSSIIKGGGRDLTRQTGQVKEGEQPGHNKIVTIDKTAANDVLRMEKKLELEKLNQLKVTLLSALDTNPKLKPFRSQILLDITSEGLRIQLVDEKNRPMFKTGSAELEPYTREILHEIGVTLNRIPNKISLTGHTDARLYVNSKNGFNNWDLSAERANACRRELIVGGMDESKVARVVGLGSAVLFDKNDPYNPVNRRISIIVMNKQTEEAAGKDAPTLNLDAEKDDDEGSVGKKLGVPDTPPSR